MIRTGRAIASAIIAGAVGAMMLAAPASADVTVSPDVAPRGGPAELSFQIPEERPGAQTTSVELIPPTDTPIAEVYPMSITGWAPLTKTTKLAKPIAVIHGTETTHVVSSIIWRRTKSAPAPKPGAAQTLTVSLGPMPETEQIMFTVVQTYSDGTVVRWGEARPGPVVRLISAGEAVAGHHGDTDDEGAADEQLAAVAEEEPSGGSPWLLWTLGVVLLLGVVFAGEAFALFTADRRANRATQATTASG